MIIAIIQLLIIYLKKHYYEYFTTRPADCGLHPLGPGLAYFIMDYGMSVNSCWIVRLAKGEIKHFDSNNVRVERNPTYGLPLKPEIPDSWTIFKEKEKTNKGELIIWGLKFHIHFCK